MASRSASIAMRLALIVPLMGLWFMVHPEQSYACSCLEPGPPSEEMEKADAVFMGRVVSVRIVEEVRGDVTHVDSVITEFDVKTVWKGPVSQTTYINSGGPCGIGFIEGVEYIVYAYHSDYRDGLGTGLCTRTTLLAWAMDDLAGLGVGTTPGQVPTALRPQSTNTPAPQPTDAPAPQPANTSMPDVSETGGGRGPWPHAIGLLVVALLAGLAWFGLRNRRSEST